jgi:hypothetical protein
LIEQHMRLSALEGRQTIVTSGVDAQKNARLGEIDQLLHRIAERKPDALVQIAAIIANVDAALAGQGR